MLYAVFRGAIHASQRWNPSPDFRAHEKAFLAKLHVHTDTTLQSLRLATKLLGNRLRHFREHIAKSYNTYETQKEYTKRMQRKAKTNKAQAGAAPAASAGHRPIVNKDGTQAHAGRSTNSSSQDIQTNMRTDKRRIVKEFSLQTFKVHALGDYVQSIEQFGTTDSYSTQIVSGHVLNLVTSDFHEV